MNTLLAKVSRKKKCYRITECNDLFSKPKELLNAHEYSNQHKLEEKEWFKITNFSQHKFAIELIKNTFEDASYEEIPNDKYEDVSQIQYLCWVKTTPEEFYFQKNNASRYVKNIKGLQHLKLGERYIIENVNPYIKIEREADAIYLKENDTLYFKRIDRLSSIFEGIQDLAKIATKEDIDKFFATPFINKMDSLNTNLLHKNVLQQIKYAQDFLPTLDFNKQKDLIKYIQKFRPNLSFTNSQFTINTEKDLSDLLDGIQENFYETEISKEKRTVNSIK